MSTYMQKLIANPREEKEKEKKMVAMSSLRVICSYRWYIWVYLRVDKL
jgi:hypothetical protein